MIYGNAAFMQLRTVLIPLVLSAASCSGAGAGSGASVPFTNQAAPLSLAQAAPCTRAVTPPPWPGPAPRPASTLRVPAGLQIQIVDMVPGARELAIAPNGDLFVGTQGDNVYIIRNAEGQPSTPRVFAQMPDRPAAGVALSVSSSNCAMYVGTQFGVYRIPYAVGDTSKQSAPVKIAHVRSSTTGSDDHRTTTVAIAGSSVYASVGSTCDACTETDPTRATIQQMGFTGSGITAKAVHVRNAIALAVNLATGTVWAGGAGQDLLPAGHPYEFFDPVTLHAGVANYGWPGCEENHHAYRTGANCSSTVIPRVEFPAYQTIIGAVFYPVSIAARYALPVQYRGGVFVSMHGGWHRNKSGMFVAPPRVAFVPMNGDVPKTVVNWSNPSVQWTDVVSGFQTANGSRIGRPTGIAVGPQGSLFVADDDTGNIYRIRP